MSWIRQCTATYYDTVTSQCCSLTTSLITRFMEPSWGPPGAGRTEVGPMLAPWILLSGIVSYKQMYFCFRALCAHWLSFSNYANKGVKYYVDVGNTWWILCWYHLIFNMGITIPKKTISILNQGPGSCSPFLPIYYTSVANDSIQHFCMTGCNTSEQEWWLIYRDNIQINFKSNCTYSIACKVCSGVDFDIHGCD